MICRPKRGGTPSLSTVPPELPFDSPAFKETTEALLLASLLVEFESRRTAADNRATVLAVFSGAQMVFILQAGYSLVQDLPYPLSWIVLLVVVAAAVIALLTNLDMVLPVRRKRRDRKKDRIAPTGKSLTWFWHVAELSAVEYRAKLQSLSEEEQQNQVVIQLTGIAAMLRKRYRQAVDAGRWLKWSLALTVCSALLNQAWVFIEGVVEYVKSIIS